MKLYIFMFVFVDRMNENCKARNSNCGRGLFSIILGKPREYEFKFFTLYGNWEYSRK